MSDIRKAIMARLGEFARPGAKAEMGFVGSAGHAGAMAARGMRDGAAAYRAGKPAVLNRLDSEYRGWSDKDLEVYGNFWMRGWTGEQMKDMTTRDPKRGTDLPGSRFSRPGAKAAFAADAGAVAKEILRQLGGGRFMAMVGGKNAMHGMFNGKPGLQVSIGKGAEGGINRLIVTLDPATDTYDMEFWRIANRGLSTKKVSEAHGVYADDLQRVFTDRTKFYTSMSRPGAKAEMGKFNSGDTVVVPYGREMVRGKIVRYDEPSMAYVVDIGKYESIKVAKEDVRKASMSRPGAKAAFGGMRDTKGRGPFTLQYTASGLYGEPTWLLVDKAGKTVAKEYNEQSAKEMLRKANAGEPVYVSSRPGAKAEFAYSGLTDASLKGEAQRLLRLWYHTKRGESGLQPSTVRYQIGQLVEEMQSRGITDPKLYAILKTTSFSRPGAKATNALSNACWQGYEAVGTKKQDGKTVPNCVPKATAAKPESQDIESEEVKAGLKLMEKSDEKVSEKIRTLIKEGKPQDQAVAIALDMKRRGEL